MNINIPVQLHNNFKAAAALQGEDMTTALLRFIEDYIKKHEATQDKKGRRQ